MAKSAAKAPKKTGKELVSMKDLEAAYAAEAKADVENEPVGGVPIIRTRGKKFKVEETVIKEPLQSVVLGTSMVNQFYDGEDFDPDNPTNPVCAAVGEVGKEKDMKPAADVYKPQVDISKGETCAQCPHAQFGSAKKGRGKACKNTRRVVLIAANDERAEPQKLVLNIPPTGLRKFSAYLKQVAVTQNRPLHGVLTNFSFDEEEDWPCPVPTLAGLIDNVGLAKRAMAARGEGGKEARAILMAPVNTQPRAVEAKPKGKAAKAKAAKGRKF